MTGSRSVDPDKPGAISYKCTWIQDRRTGVPYLCVAGEDALIKVYDIEKGQIHRTLSGHGGVRT